MSSPGYSQKVWIFKSTPFWKWVFSKSPCYCAEIIGSSQRSLVTASDELKKSKNLQVFLKVMSLWKYALLKKNFLKIPVLSCRDYWLITKVSSNCFRWAKEKWKLTGKWKRYVTLKVCPFEIQFLQIPVLSCGDYWYQVLRIQTSLWVFVVALCPPRAAPQVSVCI